MAAAAVTPSSPAGSSGLITQEGVHIPFDVHHVESLAEQGAPLCPNPAGGGPEALETVVCVPVPVQVGPGPGTLFENVPQEALGEVVASCPVPGMVPGSQVIIIAGPGYDALTAEGIHLNVAAGSGAPGGGLGDEVPCAVMEGVAAYTQTEPEGSQPSTMDPAAVAGIETKKGLGAAPVQGGCRGLWEVGGVGRSGPGAHSSATQALHGHPPCVHLPPQRRRTCMCSRRRRRRSPWPQSWRRQRLRAQSPKPRQTGRSWTAVTCRPSSMRSPRSPRSGCPGGWGLGRGAADGPTACLAWEP